MSASSRERPRSALLLVLLVLAASAVVAAAAHGLRVILPPLELSGGAVWGVWIAGLTLAIGGGAALIAQRERLAPDSVVGPDPTQVALTAAAAIMALLTLVAVLAHPPSARDTAFEGTASGSTRVLDPSNDTLPAPPPPGWIGGLGMGVASEDQREEAGPGDSPAGQDDGWLDEELRERLARGLRTVLVVTLLALGVWMLARRIGRLGEKPDEVPVPASEAEAGLEASLDAFMADFRDPRRQITAAYRRLLAVLAAAGAGREPHEAPHEHLERALAPLGLERGPLHRLAELYVVAHFSERPLTERHRTAAVDALEISLVTLREIHGSVDAGDATPMPAGSEA